MQTQVQQKHYDKSHDAKVEKPLKVINRFDAMNSLKAKSLKRSTESNLIILFGRLLQS